MTKPVHMQVATYDTAWQIQTTMNPPMWWSAGLEIPNRRRATAVARQLSFALRENGVPQAPVLTLARTDATWVLDLAQEEIKNTECMLLEEERSVDRSVRLNYEWLAELDSLVQAEDESLALDFGQACTVVDLLHEYLDVEDEEGPVAGDVYLLLLRLRDAGIDMSVYYSENSPHPGYRYELCGDKGGSWYNVYDPSDHLVASVDTRQEANQAVARHHGTANGSDETTGDVQIYAIGIVNLCVCAPANMSIEEVTRQANLLHPSGLSGPWTLADEPTFATGEPHPGVCDHDPSHRRHYLFHC